MGMCKKGIDLFKNWPKRLELFPAIVSLYLWPFYLGRSPVMIAAAHLAHFPR